MSFINISHAKIHYRSMGTGDPIILLHGISDSSNFYTPLIDSLMDMNTTAPDLRGHGKSSKDVKISMELFTEDIRDLLDELNIKRANILGFSMGSLVAQNFCLEFPERVKSIIICSGYSRCNEKLSETFKSLEILTSNGGIPAFFDRMIKLVYTHDYLRKHQELLEFKESAVNMNSKTVILHSLGICRNFDVESKLSEIDVPSLVMFGSEDGLIPPENSKNMYNQLTDSKLLSFPTGHNIFLPETIPKIATEIERFLFRI